MKYTNGIYKLMIFYNKINEKTRKVNLLIIIKTLIANETTERH